MNSINNCIENMLSFKSSYICHTLGLGECRSNYDGASKAIKKKRRSGCVKHKATETYIWAGVTVYLHIFLIPTEETLIQNAWDVQLGTRRGVDDVFWRKISAHALFSSVLVWFDLGLFLSGVGSFWLLWIKSYLPLFDVICYICLSCFGLAVVWSGLPTLLSH